MSETNNNSSRERSALYPPCSINDCIQIIEIIDKLSGKLASTDAIASELKVSSTTNSFKGKISTAKQFGLVKGNGTTIQLSESAQKYLYPTDEISRSKILLQCFLTAPLYQKIASKFENKALPTEVKLSNLLFQEFEITKAAKDTAASRFIESANQIGIIRNGVLILDADELSSQVSGLENETNKEYQSHESSFEEYNEKKQYQPDCYSFEIPMLSGSTAKIVIPKGITMKDIDFFETYVKSMLPLFLSNLKEEIEDTNKKQTT